MLLPGVLRLGILRWDKVKIGFLDQEKKPSQLFVRVLILVLLIDWQRSCFGVVLNLCVLDEASNELVRILEQLGNVLQNGDDGFNGINRLDLDSVLNLFIILNGILDDWPNLGIIGGRLCVLDERDTQQLWYFLVLERLENR